MRASVFHDFSLPGVQLDIQNKINNMLDLPASFMFSIYEIPEGGNEDLVVNFPDVFSAQPVMDEMILTVKHPKASNITECSELLKDPTWKDILNSVNNILANFGSTDLFLTGLTIVGLTENGTGYLVEPDLCFYPEIYEVCGG